MAIRVKSPSDWESPEPPRAQRRFTDREEPRQAFWNLYQKLEDKMATPSPDGSLSPQFYVLNFYGTGGLGKTRLRKKLQEELRETNSGPAAVYNFERNKDQTVTDMLTVLTALRAAICAACKERGMEEFKFPMFDLACYFRGQKLGKDSTDPTTRNTLLSDHPIVEQTLGAIATFLPGADVAAHVLDTAINSLFQQIAKKDAEKLRRELSDLEPVDILNRLPYYFTRDMVNNMQGCKKPLVIFLDTYEDLVDPLSGKNDYEDADLWLRRTASDIALPENTTPIPNIPGVLWVILGRNKLTWNNADPDWKDYLECHLLEFLKEPDSVSFLTEAGVTDKELCHDLFLLSGGLPLYLDLCVDILERLWALGCIPTIEDFGVDHPDMVNRLLRYMGTAQVDLVSRLACLDNWDDALLSELFSEAQCTDFNKVIRKLSFILSEDGVYTMHNVVREFLLSSVNCPPALKAKVWEQAEVYYGKLLPDLPSDNTWTKWFVTTAPTPDDTRYASSFAAFAKYGIARLDSSEALTAFFQEALEVRINWFLHHFMFYPVLLCAHALLNHPAANSFLLIKADILCAQAYCETGQYRQAVDASEKAVELSCATLGENAPVTLTAIDLLSRSYFSLGDSIPDNSGLRQKAVALKEKLLQLQLAVLGKDHPDTRGTLKFLYNFYHYQNRNEDAAVWLEKLAERLTDLLGESHPYTISAMQDLITTYDDMERYENAAALEEKILDHQRAALGEDHPDTLNTMFALSASYFELGRHPEAISLMEIVLKRKIALLGEGHPDILYPMDRLASYYYQSGRTAEANALMEKISCCIGNLPIE